MKCIRQPQLTRTAAIAFAVAFGLALGNTLTSQGAERHKGNIFSIPEAASEPGFKKGANYAQALQEREIPDLREVMALPTLDAGQKREIQKAAKASLTRTRTLTEAVDKLAKSLTAEVDKTSFGVAMTKSRPPHEEPGSDKIGSQNLPTQPLMVEVPNIHSDKVLRIQIRELRTQITNERLNLWDQIRPILSDEQIEDLAKMRRGEFKPQAIEAASR